ncbi:MAG: DUF4173 domain-containing protein [Oscillospiraceae bacterium]|nr:DUF4173 domain-containing protein [Oscillospiraceae bacterium]
MNEHPLPGGSAPAGEISAPFSPGRCPLCGAVAEPGTAFCIACGTPLAQPEAAAPAASPLPASKAFSASRREIIAAFVSYVLAWIYLWSSTLFLGGADDGGRPVWSLVFTLGFVALAELLFRDVKRPRESWVWLGCMGLILAGILLERDAVWGEGAFLLLPLFLHLAAMWWVLSRSGRLSEGKSGHLLPLDALHGFLLIPFKHFYLRLRTVIFAVGRPLRSRRRVKGITLLWSMLALLVALSLFALAVSLLSDADAGFGKLIGRVGDWFRFEDPTCLYRFLLSLPVGQFLFGLLAGAGREEPEKLRQRGEELCRWLERLRKVPNLVWSVLTGAFCLLYLLFFAVQSRYLFGAFTRSLPEGFIVSEYARQGFFELCRVMGINFVLLWLVTRVSRRPVREHRPTLILCLILLAESLLFAVVAFSKLALYIDCFGFTPLRLQSTWLVCVLFAGCLAALWTLLTGKKSFRAWLMFSALSLSFLCLL